MEYIPFYLVHGLTTKTRKRRLQEKIRRKAESNAAKGLPTRIPFLKKSLCGQDVPNGESPRVISSRRTAIEANVGDTIALNIDWKIYFKFIRFWENIRVFNSLNARNGIQAIPLSGVAPMRYVVGKCDIRYVGDLKTSRLLDSDLNLASAGLYHPLLYQIFVKKDQIHRSWRSVLTHELEHATHYSLLNLYGFPFFLMNSEDAEYLSILKTMHTIGDTRELLLCESPYLQYQITDDGIEPSHDVAAKKFFAFLQSRCGLSEYEIAMGVAWSMRERLDQLIDPSNAEHLEKIQRAAEAEYRRTYEAIFGLSLEDIKEIIDNLPVI